jgi:hypothetical protein
VGITTADVVAAFAFDVTAVDNGCSMRSIFETADVGAVAVDFPLVAAAVVVVVGGGGGGGVAETASVEVKVDGEIGLRVAESVLEREGMIYCVEAVTEGVVLEGAEESKVV